MTKGPKAGVYVIYRGEELVAIGTVAELARELGIKEESVRYLRTPSNKKRDKGNRMVLYPLEEENE